MTEQTAMFGAGCFWGVEWVFSQVPGVSKAVSGYSGGHTQDPSYREVCSHTTGHAEVVQVTFDPDVVTYDQLLQVFWAMHDPTQVDRQGPDVGDQYRSGIYTYSAEQQAAAEASRDMAQARFHVRSPRRSCRLTPSTPPKGITRCTTRRTATSRTAMCCPRASWRTWAL